MFSYNMHMQSVQNAFPHNRRRQTCTTPLGAESLINHMVTSPRNSEFEIDAYTTETVDLKQAIASSTPDGDLISPDYKTLVTNLKHEYAIKDQIERDTDGYLASSNTCTAGNSPQRHVQLRPHDKSKASPRAHDKSNASPRPYDKSKASPNYDWLFATMADTPQSIYQTMACDQDKINRIVRETTNVLEDLYDRIGPPWIGKGKPLLRSGIPGHVAFFKEVDYGDVQVQKKVKRLITSLGGVPQRRYVPCRPRVKLGVSSLGASDKVNAYDMLIGEEMDAIKLDFDISRFLPLSMFMRDLGNSVSLVFCLYMYMSYMLNTINFEILE